MKDFRGGSQKFYIFLTYCSGLETIFGLVMLVSFGINTELMNALKLIGILIVSNTILVSVESIIALKILKIDYSDCWIKLLKYRLV